MNRSKQQANKSKANRNQAQRHNNNQQNQRSDYHQPQYLGSSDDESQELLIYPWSGVIPIYTDPGYEVEIITAEIDTEHMKTDTKGPRGRPIQ